MQPVTVGLGVVAAITLNALRFVLRPAEGARNVSLWILAGTDAKS